MTRIGRQHEDAERDGREQAAQSHHLEGRYLGGDLLHQRVVRREQRHGAEHGADRGPVLEGDVMRPGLRPAGARVTSIQVGDIADGVGAVRDHVGIDALPNGTAGRRMPVR